MSASIGVLFAFVAGASFGGVLPSQLRLLAGGLALAGFVAAALFTGEARGVEEQLAQLKAQRELAALDERLLVPVAAVADVDATLIGVDKAVQEILPGGALPRYLARDVDEALRAAFAAALDGHGPWIVVAVGMSKAGKSRALFEALEHSTRGKAVDLVAPRDGDALRSMLIPGQAPVRRAAVLWLDDLEPFLGDNVTVHTLRSWRDAFPGSVVAATLGGKGAGRVSTSSAPTVSALADAVLGEAWRVEVAPTSSHEVGPLLSSVSSTQAAAIKRHGLAAFLVAAPKLATKLSTCRHEAGQPCPEGRAVVDVAVDWARCGRTDAITQPTLRELWTTGRRDSAPVGDDVFRAALDWALRPVAGTIALLHHVSGGYEPFDYVVALARDARTPDGHAWAAAIATGTDAQALSVGIAAFGCSRLDDAVNAFARASTSTTREIAAISTFNKGVTLGVLGRSDEEIAVYDELIARDGERDELALREPVANALVNKGVTLGVLGRSDEEIAVYDELIARDGERDELALREQVAKALVNKGVTLGVLGRSDEEIAVYDELIARDGERDELALREQVAKALVNKGVTLGVLGRSDEEIAVYDELIARDGERDELALREPVANALVNKGVRLGVLGRSDDAIAVYDELIARDGERDELALREPVANALVNKGVRLGVLGRSDDAIAVYDELIARDGERDELALREPVANALVNKGVTLGVLGRSDDAIAVYDELIARDGERDELALREPVAKALVNKGVRLGVLGRSDEEIAVYDELIARDGERDELALREPVAKALVNKGVTLGVLGRSDDAIAVYDELIARDGERDELALREPVAKALVNKGVTLGVLGRSDDAIAVYDELIARDGERDELALREQVAKALVNKGFRLGVLGRSDDAIAVYDQLIAHYDDAPEPALRKSVANALGNSAKLRLERREYAGAIDMIRSAFQHADDDSDPLRAELWMYLFALGPHDQRANARVELVRLLRAGVRSPGWDFSLIVANAIEQRHDDSDRLVALADVISTHEDIRILDGWMVETDQ